MPVPVWKVGDIVKDRHPEVHGKGHPGATIGIVVEAAGDFLKVCWPGYSEILVYHYTNLEAASPLEQLAVQGIELHEFYKRTN